MGGRQAGIHDPHRPLSSPTCGPRRATGGLRDSDHVKALEQEVLALLHAAPCCRGSSVTNGRGTGFFTALVACA